MSLCVGFKVGNDVLVAVDGRASLVYGGITYCVKEDTPKYLIHNKKFLVIFGNSDVTQKFMSCCKANSGTINIETIFDSVITSKRIEQYNADVGNSLLLSVYDFDIENSKIKCIYWGKEWQRSIYKSYHRLPMFGNE